MRILVATDAWRPQVNGVVRTYERLSVEAAKLGATIEFLTPEPFPTIPLPTYTEIRLALLTSNEVEARVRAFRPDFVHIATEGPIGLVTRYWCNRQSRRFTTSYHTRFPDYLSARLPVPLEWGYHAQAWFHNAGAGMMVSTQSLAQELGRRGFQRIMPWTRGVDTELFHPRAVRPFGSDPVFLYVGRVAVEKNIDDFLKLELPGRKVVVGGGPELTLLTERYPEVLFTGPRSGQDLAESYAGSDVFVFPSRTDTFGIVLLEALASGLPIAAYPVTGPIDVVEPGVTGVLDENLRQAALGALELDRTGLRNAALKFGWEACAQQFIDNLLSANGSHRVSEKP
jgi:glycosyltransferase involved in cell wall biosynthesis